MTAPLDRRDAYLSRALTLDGSELTELMELRREFNESGDESGDEVERRSAAARDAARTELDAIREGFWSVDRNELEERLEALDLDGLPDLERERARVVRAFDVREDLSWMVQERRVPPELVVALREIVIASPPKAAAIRREYLASRTGLGWDLAHLFALRIIRRDYAATREAERTFLDRIRTRRRDWGRSGPPAAEFSLWRVVKALLIVFGLLALSIALGALRSWLAS